MKSIVYEDDFIVAVFKAGESETLVISFGDMANLANGMNISAETPLSKYNFNILGFSAKTKNWYPELSIINSLKSISKTLKSFKKVVCYGGSMGGYAAIKYSKLLQANKVVAFVPQYSINPNNIADKRYSHYFNEVMHKNMEIRQEDINENCSYTMVYDPCHKDDVEHIEKIKPYIHNAKIFKLRFAEHSVTYILASSDLLNDFIQDNVSQDVIYKKMRSLKRTKGVYAANLLNKAIKNNGLFLLNLLSKPRLVALSFDKQITNDIIALAIKRHLLNSQLLKNLGIERNINNGFNLYTTHKSVVVYNTITNRLESYNIETLSKYEGLLIPVSIKLGILSIYYRNILFNIYGNSKGDLQLVKDGSPIPDNFHPLLLNKKSDYLYISLIDSIVASALLNNEVKLKKTVVKAWEMFYIA